MWLTCQMGVDVPSDESAWIRVGTERKHWRNGKTMVYDTTVSESSRFRRFPKQQTPWFPLRNPQVHSKTQTVLNDGPRSQEHHPPISA